MITPEERAAIVTLLMAGGSNRQIAAKVGVTVNAVAGVRFRAHGVPTGRTMTAVAAEQRRDRAAIMQALSLGPKKPKELSEITGLSLRRLTWLGEQLERYGRITRTGRGGATRWERKAPTL